jgi:hypothetical protein
LLSKSLSLLITVFVDFETELSIDDPAWITNLEDLSCLITFGKFWSKRTNWLLLSLSGIAFSRVRNCTESSAVGGVAN